MALLKRPDAAQAQQAPQPPPRKRIFTGLSVAFALPDFMNKAWRSSSPEVTLPDAAHVAAMAASQRVNNGSA